MRLTQAQPMAVHVRVTEIRKGAACAYLRVAQIQSQVAPAKIRAAQPHGTVSVDQTSLSPACSTTRRREIQGLRGVAQAQTRAAQAQTRAAQAQTRAAQAQTRAAQAQSKAAQTQDPPKEPMPAHLLPVWPMTRSCPAVPRHK